MGIEIKRRESDHDIDVLAEIAAARRDWRLLALCGGRLRRRHLAFGLHRCGSLHGAGKLGGKTALYALRAGRRLCRCRRALGRRGRTGPLQLR